MKLNAPALRELLSTLPVYNNLPVPARREVLGIQKLSSTSLAAGFRSLQALVDAGFLMTPNEQGRTLVPVDRHNSVRTLRVVAHHDVLQNPSFESFSKYVSEHLDVAEREKLRGFSGNLREAGYALYRLATSPAWITKFLSARSDQWEAPYLLPGSPALLDKKVLRAAQDMIRWLLQRKGSAPLLEAMTALNENSFDDALVAALRYLLVYLAIDPETQEVRIGLWTSIAHHLELAGSPPPAAIVPAETFDPGSILLDDLTTLLIACSHGPLPVKANNATLYAKTAKELSATFRPLPKWVDNAFDLDTEVRLSVAVAYGRSFKLVEFKGHPSSSMGISEQGRKWLALSAGDRLRVLVDGVLNNPQTVPDFKKFEGAQIEIYGVYLDVVTHKNATDLNAAMLKVFQSLQGDGFFPVTELQRYFSVAMNPLLEIFAADITAQLWNGGAYMERPDTEKLKAQWSESILNCIRSRLFPLGGIHLGHGTKELSIAITPAGRYFLRQTEEWTWGGATSGGIIVQPNFEVMFLAESPAAEADIGRFAERRGQQMGALFQITKKSIYAAAAAGMTAGEVLDVLRNVSTREIPGNVEREIQGWFAQCRSVAFTPAMLIRCQDRETALRVIALAKGSATAISDTILEYKDPGKQRTALIKKLKDMGVMVSVTEEKKAAPKRVVRYARRRRGWW